MKLNEKNLDDWLKKPKLKFMKHGGDDFPFYSNYDTFQNHLKNGLHSEVTKGAIFQEIASGKKFEHIIWLNDHGPKHIAAVIERASQLLDNGKEDLKTWSNSLNAKEVFLLLSAIQVHDIGNFYGRIGHEKKVLQAIGIGLTPILFDSREVHYLNDIAQVHGGKVLFKDGTSSKNTIRQLKQKVTSDGYDLRLRMLAAILRFADELADEKKRADIKSLDEGQITPGSEIFHAFSACLDSTKVVHEENTIKLFFKIPKKYLERKFGKLVKDKKGKDIVEQVHLLDEIYLRMMKMHHERIYCSKFWENMISINKLWIEIEFYTEAKDKDSFDLKSLVVHDDITFTLRDDNYPTSSEDIFTHCPELKYPDGTTITGDNLLAKISTNER